MEERDENTVNDSPARQQPNGGGAKNLGMTLRNLVEMGMRALPENAENVLAVLGALHDQGIVNLDTPVRKAVAAVSVQELASMQANLMITSNYCFVVRSQRPE
jgi:hypothetical protein